ncbi:MAG TPA: AAA family ATPase [Candidatus Bathyarchaeia archaeon]|nr:AAA family ATPase [Candidatus Bathyarchaeia archaeon]HLP49006.1 AAA family ATPase [Candidatus Kapabacteria bacterium]
MNKIPTLVIVSGLPAAGKTTLATSIAEKFNFPLISADTIKEVMWNTMGHEFDFDFSDKLGRTAFELLFHFIELSLSKGVSLVVEAHFSPEINNERINELKEDYGSQLIQIYCDCETEVLRKRFKERMKKDSYHKGHRHTISLYGEDKVLNSLGTKNKRLNINGVTYDLDTTKPDEIDYEKLFDFILNNIK